MSWLARSIGLVVAGAVVALGGACEQPNGVVLKIEGIADAHQLWLAVGDKPMSVPAQTSTLRFEASELNTLLTAPEGQTSYHEGYEIFLDSDTLLERSKLAVVLDATVPAQDPSNIVRGSYLLEPVESGQLTEVRLRLGEIGPGQWVCAGQRGAAAEPSFLVDGGTDCDRDGWLFASDPDDLDPLNAGTLKWGLDLENPALCTIMAGSRRLRLQPILQGGGCGASCTRTPADAGEFDGCLDDQDVVRCKIGKRSHTFSVKTLIGNMPVTNPDWELVKLGGEGATAVFAPTFQALDDWSVTFALAPPAKDGWFLLTDRARGNGISMAIRLEFNEGSDNTCVVDQRAR